MFGAKRRVRASEGDGVEDHQALAWGWGGEGRLGTGGLNAEDLAAPVAHSRHLGGHFVDVASSRRHSLMCTEHGKVYAFGEGVRGKPRLRSACRAILRSNSQTLKRSSSRSSRKHISTQQRTAQRSLQRKQKLAMRARQAAQAMRVRSGPRRWAGAGADAAQKRHSSASWTRRNGDAARRRPRQPPAIAKRPHDEPRRLCGRASTTGCSTTGASCFAFRARRFRPGS